MLFVTFKRLLSYTYLSIQLIRELYNIIITILQTSVHLLSNGHYSAISYYCFIVQQFYSYIYISPFHIMLMNYCYLFS